MAVDIGVMAPVDANGQPLTVADPQALCPDCLANGFRRTIAGHKHDSAVKVRTGESCPLCGGKFHGREVSETLQDFACAWRQWEKATTGKAGGRKVDASNLVDFAAWMQANPTLEYGKRAQLTAWGQMQTSGTFAGKLTPAMASDLQRHLNPARGTKVQASDPQGPMPPAPSVQDAPVALCATCHSRPIAQGASALCDVCLSICVPCIQGNHAGCIGHACACTHSVSEPEPVAPVAEPPTVAPEPKRPRAGSLGAILAPITDALDASAPPARKRGQPKQDASLAGLSPEKLALIQEKLAGIAR